MGKPCPGRGEPNVFVRWMMADIGRIVLHVPTDTSTQVWPKLKNLCVDKKTPSITATPTQTGSTSSNTEIASSNTSTPGPSSSSASGRISGGTIGGIVGGIVGGFLILGALTYWWMRRYKRRLLRTVEGPRADSWYYEDSGQFGSVNSSKRETQQPTEETVVNGGRLGKQYYK